MRLVIEDSHPYRATNSRVDLLERKGRSIPLAEIQSVSPYSVTVYNEKKITHPEYDLVIETLGQPLQVGQSCQGRWK